MRPLGKNSEGKENASYRHLALGEPKISGIQSANQLKVNNLAAQRALETLDEAPQSSNQSQ